MEKDVSRVMDHLVEVEEMAEEILADRQHIIELDRKRQKTREAVRAVQKDKKTKKSWVCFGNMFLKLPRNQTTTLLNTDFDNLDTEISEVRSNIKKKVSKLRDMEHKDELKGFNLNSLSSQEMKSLSDVL